MLYRSVGTGPKPRSPSPVSLCVSRPASQVQVRRPKRIQSRLPQALQLAVTSEGAPYPRTQVPSRDILHLAIKLLEKHAAERKEIVSVCASRSSHLLVLSQSWLLTSDLSIWQMSAPASRIKRLGGIKRPRWMAGWKRLLLQLGSA